MLAEFFCLRARDLAELLYGRITDSTEASVRRTVDLLEKQGYVNKTFYRPDDYSGCGQIPYACGLSDAGLRRIADELFLPREACGKTFDEHSAGTVHHELGISRFHRALGHYCAERGFRCHWDQRNRNRAIAPDAYFAITDPVRPEGKNALHYFLEIERAKIGNMKNGEPSIIRKLARYYEYFNSDRCEREWQAFRRFRVIIVVRNDQKRRNLLAALSERHAHRMFWLTTEDLVPADPGGEIFLTPKDYRDRAYSFAGAFQA